MSDDGVIIPSGSDGQASLPSVNQRQHHHANFRTQVEWVPIPLTDINELLDLANMDGTTDSTSGYFDLSVGRDAAPIDLNIAPVDDEALDIDRVTRARAIDLNMEPDSDECEMELEYYSDAMFASWELNDDFYHDNNHVDASAELISFTEIVMGNDYLTEDLDQRHWNPYSTLDEYDTQNDDPLVLNLDMSMTDFRVFSMETNDIGNEEIDTLYEVSMETYDNVDEEFERILLESIERHITMKIPASKSAIKELEKVRLKSVEAATHAGPCIICMEDFKAGSETTRLPCQHFYHGDCVVQWLEIDCRCPLCRFAMPHD